MWMKILRFNHDFTEKNLICMKCSMSAMEPKAIFGLVTFEKESLRSWRAPLPTLSSCIKTSRHIKRQSATLVPSSTWFSVAAGCSLRTWIIWPARSIPFPVGWDTRVIRDTRKSQILWDQLTQKTWRGITGHCSVGTGLNLSLMKISNLLDQRRLQVETPFKKVTCTQTGEIM